MARGAMRVVPKSTVLAPIPHLTIMFDVLGAPGSDDFLSFFIHGKEV